MTANYKSYTNSSAEISKEYSATFLYHCNLLT